VPRTHGKANRVFMRAATEFDHETWKVHARLAEQHVRVIINSGVGAYKIGTEVVISDNYGSAPCRDVRPELPGTR
jgi:hypothetical protein